MADINNFDSLVTNFSNILSSVNNDLSRLREVQSKYVEELQRSSVQNIKDLRDITTDNEKLLRDILDKEIESRKKATDNISKDIENLSYKELKLKEETATIENETVKQHLNEKLEQLKEERQLKEEELAVQNLINEGKIDEVQKLKSDFEIKRLVNKEQEAEAKRHNQELEELHKKQKSNLEKFIDISEKATTMLVRTATNIGESGINSVVNVYEQHATKLSVALDTTVSGISDLQNKIASNLRSEGLSKAISNVQVLNEASSLVSSGYTNVDKIQQNATDVVIGKQLAPNLDFNNSTVKNLTNVFGSDFITKFTAIQQATQDTAGSVVSLSETVSSLINNLEPVFTNAELSNAALQGTSDVAATLSNAREQGLITEGQESEYRSMLIELMDPSKAFTSKNTAVRIAAQNYSFDGNPASALNALLSATKNMYNNVGQSMSSDDIISRSLFANAMGFNSLSAAYMPSGYTDVNMSYTDDLGGVYEQQLNNLESGSYTTRSQRVTNATENSVIVQGVADFAKTFPNLYKTFSSTIVTAINSLPQRIAKAIKTNGIAGGRAKTPASSSDDVENIYSDTSKIPKSGSLSSKLSSTPVGKAFSNSNAKFGGRLGGLATMSYMAGITGLTNIASDFNTEDGISAADFTNQGNVLQSTLNYAGIGASLGTLFGGAGLGTGIGALIGAIGGLTASLFASHQIEEENNRLIEEQNKLSEKTLGAGITKLSYLEQQTELARGGGTVDINSGTAAMDMDYYFPSHASGLDYVPYDNYIAKLHKGEAVVTANAAKAFRKENPNFWNIPQNNNDDVVDAIEKQTQSIVKAVNNEQDNMPMINQEPQQYVIANTSI